MNSALKERLKDDAVTRIKDDIMTKIEKGIIRGHVERIFLRLKANFSYLNKTTRDNTYVNCFSHIKDIKNNNKYMKHIM